MNQMSTERRAEVIRCLVEGNSIRSTVRMTGAAKNTVTKLLCDIGSACSVYQYQQVRGLGTMVVQVDEIWSFVGSKAKNTSDEKRMEGCGDAWTWVAIDADSKLVVTWYVGLRDENSAHNFMSDLAGRLTKRIQLTSDGLGLYRDAVKVAFGKNVDYGMLVKTYGAEPGSEIRYSPSVCNGAKANRVFGDPIESQISTSYVERQNLTMRMSMRRFTRLTNAFSKKIENHEHAVALHFMYYNFCRKHQTLKTTPAVAARVTDHVWTIEEMIEKVLQSN